jgi:hypothetical protein
MSRRGHIVNNRNEGGENSKIFKYKKEDYNESFPFDDGIMASGMEGSTKRRIRSR